MKGLRSDGVLLQGGRVQKEYIKGSGVALKDFSESAEKKKGGGNGFPRAEAELMRVEGVINGI